MPPGVFIVRAGTHQQIKRAKVFGGEVDGHEQSARGAHGFGDGTDGRHLDGGEIAVDLETGGVRAAQHVENRHQARVPTRRYRHDADMHVANATRLVAIDAGPATLASAP